MNSRQYLIIAILFLYFPSVIIAQDEPKARETCNWQAYESSSVISKDSIMVNMLQGNWIEFEKIYYSNCDYRIAACVVWQSNNALQINKGQYRKTLAGKFYSLEVNSNQIIFQTEQQPDTAYINLLTSKKMKISYKKEENYIQYLYKK